ncbi:DUF11 domain-containing protein [Candidatus Kaiserbacteria bacterium]|nr:DUF11 domain-containing protein [Candidatus Kaiserbacteria bacterium]
MNKKTIIKASTLAVIGMVATFAMFVAGSYDPYNELSVLSTDSACASVSGGSAHVSSSETAVGIIKWDEWDENCYEEAPKVPSCPYPKKENRTIVKFNDRIRSDKGYDRSVTDIESVNLEAGTYQVFLASWDGYIGRESVTQPLEQWTAVLTGGGNNIAETSAVSDIPDKVREALVKEKVENEFVLTQSVNGVYAEHVYLGKDKSPNSVNPICAVFDKVEDPKECKLELKKEVDKTSAKPGEVIEYTIKIKNVGTADCTGGGVRIYDELDRGLTFVNSTYTSNINAGYGNDPLYTERTRTLRWNGNTLNPGEEGTIVVQAKVSEPNSCGDYKVENQAKATAKELNNFNDYAYSNKVKTDVNKTCAVDPVCKSFTASPNSFNNGTGGTVKLTWDTENTESVSIDNGVGSVSEDGNINVNVTDDITYTLTATGNGKSVTCPASVTVTEPEPKEVKIIADKVVCTEEADLPNWGAAGGPDITANTAANWVATHSSCSLASDWEFQWGPSSVSNPGDSFVGRAGSGWVNFGGSTNLNGRTSTEVTLNSSIGDRIWVREVLKNGYIPFTYLTNNKSNVDNVTAEMYCHSDVKNYDNYDFISNPVAGETYHCIAFNSPVRIDTPDPVCKSFTASPNSFNNGTGGTVKLTWDTENTESVSIDNGVGSVSEDGNINVNVTDDITYTLTATGNGKSVTCPASVTVTEPENTLPECVSFTASPTAFGENGGTSKLTWNTSRATDVSIDNGIGKVSEDGSMDVSITKNITYTLTAKDADGDTDQCRVSMTVEEKSEPLSCESDVDFTISDTKVDKGDSITLDWNVSSRVTEVSIDQGIGSVANTGNKTFSVDDDTTYTLTAKAGSETVKCSVSVDMDGGGGGGSSSPRCELEISDRKIKRGEEITISWDTTRATEVTLYDDKDKILFTTNDYLNKDKEDYYDGSIEVKPTRDTEYTLIAERGSKDKVCRVDVEVEDGTEIVIIEERTQTPLVAGISLTSVPYTGFDAGPLLTMLFYLVLMTWALYIAYVIVVKKNMFVTAGNPIDKVTIAESQESISPQSFVKAVTPPAPSVVKNVVPANLPVKETASVVGYTQTVSTPTYVTEEAVKAIEDKAHINGTLLSSDAIREFLTLTQGSEDSEAVLDCVLSAAKVKFPMEDGWVVLNHDKMASLCAECMNEAPATKAQVSIPTGSGSLAESIVSGNITAAYALIGHRPMVALADASADLDALYRARKGETNEVSNLLKSASATLTDEQIKDAITALTSALDGTYGSEAEAVKMAIMKAVKAVA